ncbi:hypothetical protein HPB52_014452 [Rhipicephalus sanguineus]|uniref:Uncharacterized protein n=1 Tax=Rhipicephalus sanguineus TaxID=34632 RepID=A0A9D4PEG4_RHISA|nr:hypothetical protein HPB52_014452 [Rhipicephalus sanguineus]
MAVTAERSVVPVAGALGSSRVQRPVPDEVLPVRSGVSVAADANIRVSRVTTVLISAKTLHEEGGKKCSGLYLPQQYLFPASISAQRNGRRVLMWKEWYGSPTVWADKQSSEEDGVVEVHKLGPSARRLTSAPGGCSHRWCCLPPEHHNHAMPGPQQ